MPTTQAIPYKTICQIIQTTPEQRTRALLTFAFASGARIGELLKYTHKLKDGREVTTLGLLKENIQVTEDEITWTMPNFKRRLKKTQIWTEGEKTDRSILWEETILYNEAVSWLKVCPNQVFEIKESRARQLIREALLIYGYKAGDIKNLLRHSRATFEADITNGDVFAVNTLLGDSTLNIALTYVHRTSSKKKKKEYLQNNFSLQ